MSPHGTHVHHAYRSADLEAVVCDLFAPKCCAGPWLFGSNSDACEVAGRKGQSGQQSPLSSSDGAEVDLQNWLFPLVHLLSLRTFPFQRWVYKSVLTSGCIEHLYLVNLKETVL